MFHPHYLEQGLAWSSFSLIFIKWIIRENITEKFLYAWNEDQLRNEWLSPFGRWRNWGPGSSIDGTKVSLGGSHDTWKVHAHNGPSHRLSLRAHLALTVPSPNSFFSVSLMFSVSNTCHGKRSNNTVNSESGFFGHSVVKNPPAYAEDMGYDLGWPRPAVAGIPSQWLRPGCVSESTKSQSLDQWSVTRALALRLCRKEFPQRWKVVEQVKCLLRGKIVQYMWIDTRAVSGRESRWVAPSWQLESLLWGISSGFPLANHLDFSGSLSIFDILQDPPMCAHASLSQDGFYRKGVWVAHPLAWLPFGLQGAFLCICGRGGLVTSGMRNTWSRWGPASSLNCPAIFFLEFWSTALVEGCLPASCLRSVPGWGTSPGEGNGNLLQYSCWEIPWTEEPGGLHTVHGVAKESDMT